MIRWYPLFTGVTATGAVSVVVALVEDAHTILGSFVAFGIGVDILATATYPCHLTSVTGSLTVHASCDGTLTITESSFSETIVARFIRAPPTGFPLTDPTTLGAPVQHVLLATFTLCPVVIAVRLIPDIHTAGFGCIFGTGFAC